MSPGPTTVVMLVALISAGCGDDSVTRGNAGAPDAQAAIGHMDASGPPVADAKADAPVEDTGILQGGFELCNGRDDDGDSRVDEGAETTCITPNAVSICGGGICSWTDCKPGFADCDADTDNGCEAPMRGDPNHCEGCNMACTWPEVCYWLNTDDFGYCGPCNPDEVGPRDCPFFCAVIAEDDAVCNLRDDDCDGNVDEDVDLQTDRQHCGMCGHVCAEGSLCRGGICVCDDDAGSAAPDGGCG